jgi:hypothetical protein
VNRWQYVSNHERLQGLISQGNQIFEENPGNLWKTLRIGASRVPDVSPKNETD